MIVVNWSNKDEELPEPDFTSVAIASYVTAQARLYLYSFMEKLGERLLYCDTDSVFFKQGPADPPLEKGDFLGQMTDELDKWPGSCIQEFVCGKFQSQIYFETTNNYLRFLMLCFAFCFVLYRRSKELCFENKGSKWQCIYHLQSSRINVKS